MGSPGGGYDTYTRTVGAFLEKKLGAKIIPTNETAAGGMIAMNRTINAPAGRPDAAADRRRRRW